MQMPSQPWRATSWWNSTGKRCSASAFTQYSSGKLAQSLAMDSRTTRCESVRSGSWPWRYSVARAWICRGFVDGEESRGGCSCESVKCIALGRFVVHANRDWGFCEENSMSVEFYLRRPTLLQPLRDGSGVPVVHCTHQTSCSPSHPMQCQEAHARD